MWNVQRVLQVFSDLQEIRLAPMSSLQISNQQERFKTGLLADGIDLNEMVEVEAAPQRSMLMRPGNKYSTMILKKREAQLKERQQDGFST